VASDPIANRADQLADFLMQVAGDQNVRAVEAVAAALANRIRNGGIPEDEVASGETTRPGLAEAGAHWRGERWELCRRIARRALKGSLADLTAGATAFHRIDADPDWARPLLPVAVFGNFLFYRAGASPCTDRSKL
jgi:hypothetical protein